MGEEKLRQGEGDLETVAAALAQRVLWERENGALGYRRKAPGDAVVERLTFEHEGDKGSLLAGLREEIGDCTRCPLHAGRNKLVFGDGNPEASLVFVGEGPGRDEDLSGVPFVGAAGQLLTKIIEAIGLSREQVYICNVVKCRPPNNRDPQPLESDTCGPFMLRQLEIIRPRVVVALGRPSAQFLLNTDLPIGRLRGAFHDLRGMKVMPTYHPAYLLRNPSGKRAVWEDMKKVRDELQQGPV